MSWTRSRVRGRALLAVSLLRLAVVGLLGLALVLPLLPGLAGEEARPRQVVYVVDVSRSVDLAAAVAAVRSDALRLSARDRVALVATGGRPSQVLALAPAAELARVTSASLSAAAAALQPGESDLARGLREAPLALGPGGAPEVVLVSDGQETRGDAAREADRLRARGVGVRALPAPVGLAPQLIAFTAQRPWVEEGEGIRLRVRLQGRGRLRPLIVWVHRTQGGPARSWRFDEQLGSRPLALSVRDRAQRPGLLHYRLEAGGRSWGLALPVVASPRVLVVAGRAGVARPVLTALEGAGAQLEQRRPGELPTRGEGLRRFGAIVLVDVPARAGAGLSRARQQALTRYVERGGGLLVIGGSQAFGAGGYPGSALEALLPVRSQPPRGELPTLALVLLIDRSSSMAGPKLELAKVAACEALGHLTARDTLGVVAFNKRARWSVTPRQGLVPAQARALIEVHAAGGGTDLLPALELAQRALARSRSRVKHVIALTDGILPRAAELVARAAALRRAGITLSTVALGEDADQAVLRRLAATGGGRHHAVSRAQSLPRIVVQETGVVAKRAGRSEPFRPQPVRPAPVLRGIDLTRGPLLWGLARTRPQPTARVWLWGPARRPLLAGWEVGGGRVAAWTSDGGQRWARDWWRWDGSAQLLRQVVRHLAPPGPRIEVGGAELTWSRAGGGLRATITAADPHGLTLELVGPAGRVAFLPAVATRRDRAEVVIPSPGPGAYSARVLRGRALLARRGLSVPLHRPESTRRPSLAVTPSEAVSGSPGRRPWDAGLLLLAAALLLVEVGVRRAAQ